MLGSSVAKLKGTKSISWLIWNAKLKEGAANSGIMAKRLKAQEVGMCTNNFNCGSLTYLKR